MASTDDQSGTGNLACSAASPHAFSSDVELGAATEASAADAVPPSENAGEELSVRNDPHLARTRPKAKLTSSPCPTMRRKRSAKSSSSKPCSSKSTSSKRLRPRSAKRPASWRRRVASTSFAPPARMTRRTRYCARSVPDAPRLPRVSLSGRVARPRRSGAHC